MGNAMVGDTIGRLPSSSSAGIDPTIVMVISIILALVAAILIWVLVLPEKKRPTLNKFFGFVADVFNFKSLLIEKILKFTYVLSTVFAIIFGFCMLFVVSYGDWMGGYGLVVMLLGPIGLRLIYEGFMLVILLVKNVIEINKKLDKKKEEAEAE
ncbi:MAG: hypothetical protein E7539_03940 [Ruminococcaceae bacterium]|nr:hypothetical protein [Oscillospiraceae bacterium]